MNFENHITKLDLTDLLIDVLESLTDITVIKSLDPQVYHDGVMYNIQSFRFNGDSTVKEIAARLIETVEQTNGATIYIKELTRCRNYNILRCIVIP